MTAKLVPSPNPERKLDMLNKDVEFVKLNTDPFIFVLFILL